MIGKLIKKPGGYSFILIHKGTRQESDCIFKTVDQAHASFKKAMAQGDLGKAPGQINLW